MKPSYEELEEQLNRSRRLCDAALANERVWETAMMQACGEDGPKSVAEKFAALEQQLAESQRELRAADATIENLQMQVEKLAAENTGLKDFVKICFRAAADGASLDGADIQELGERLGLFGRETYQPALHGYICGHEAGEDTVYVMKKTPATDAFLDEVRASGVDYAIGVIKYCANNLCPGGTGEAVQYAQEMVTPYLDSIHDKLADKSAQLRKGVQL